MVHLLFSLSEKGQAHPPPPARRHDRTAAHHLASVHLTQADDHRTVAHEYSQDQQGHERWVGQGESAYQAGAHIPRRVHVNKAPCPGTVLPELTVSGERQEAEAQRKEINQEKGYFGKAATDVHGVEIRVADGQTSLHCHGAQDKHGRESEETHGKAKELAQSLPTQADQGNVPSVAGKHGRAEDTGAQQVCERQAGHKDAEDRRPGAVFFLMDPKDEEGQEVPHHTSQKHDDACRRFALLVDGEGVVAGAVVAGRVWQHVFVHVWRDKDVESVWSGWKIPRNLKEILTSRLDHLVTQKAALTHTGAPHVRVSGSFANTLNHVAVKRGSKYKHQRRILSQLLFVKCALKFSSVKWSNAPIEVLNKLHAPYLPTWCFFKSPRLLIVALHPHMVKTCSEQNLMRGF